VNCVSNRFLIKNFTSSHVSMLSTGSVWYKSFKITKLMMSLSRQMLTLWKVYLIKYTRLKLKETSSWERPRVKIQPTKLWHKLNSKIQLQELSTLLPNLSKTHLMHKPRRIQEECHLRSNRLLIMVKLRLPNFMRKLIKFSLKSASSVVEC